MFEQAKNFAFPATSFMQSEGEQGTFGEFASGYLKQSFNSGLSLASAFSPVLGGLSGYLSLGISPSEASGAATFELGSFAASSVAGGGSGSLSKLRLPTWRKAPLILKDAGASVNRTMTFTQKQLQKKYASHAEDFGLFGNANKANLAAFQNAIVNHAADASTLVIQGSYRKVQNVHHFYNPNTGINVMRDMNGNFLSGWKLSSGQAKNVMERGSL